MLSVTLFLSFSFSCSRWSFVDVPLIFSCPVDHVQYRIGNHVYYWVWLRPDRLVEEHNNNNLNVLTFSPLTGGCSEGLGALRFFFKHNNVNTKTKQYVSSKTIQYAILK